MKKIIKYYQLSEASINLWMLNSITEHLNSTYFSISLHHYPISLSFDWNVVRWSVRENSTQLWKELSIIIVDYPVILNLVFTLNWWWFTDTQWDVEKLIRCSVYELKKYCTKYLNCTAGCRSAGCLLKGAVLLTCFYERKNFLYGLLSQILCGTFK